MKIRHIQIERFRGIRQMEWRVGGNFVCLVGPGDSTKTTILDAIEFALSPRWNIPFDDSDFYDTDTSAPIVITVTVGDLPEEFKSDARYGYLARGWTANGDLHDEPAEDDEMVLSIQLRVDRSLEQSWTVVNDRNPEGCQRRREHVSRLAV
jgi:ribose 1,5-bisphosphokinase PhnN